MTKILYIHKTMRALQERIELEHTMLESWLPVAEKHAALSGGDIGVLEIDPAYYPAQAIDACHITPELVMPEMSRSRVPRSSKGVELAATLVEPRFADITAMLEADQDNIEALDAANEILRNGESIVLVTNHLQLTDVVIAQAAVHNYLKRTNDEFRTALIISKMVSLLASNNIRDEKGRPVPGIMALQVLCDDTYLSYPKTETTSKLVIAQKMPGEIASNNRQVAALAKENLGKGAVLLAMSPSGSTDVIDARRETCELKRVQSGTAKIMAHENAHVLSVAIILGADGPYIKVDGMPRKLKDPAESHLVMRGLTSVLNKSKASKLHFVYGGSSS